MVFLIGTKRTYDAISSDVEDDDRLPHGNHSVSMRVSSSSTAAPTPSSSRHENDPITPAKDGRKPKRKVPRHSEPADSPTNLFRVGPKATFYGPKDLPEPVSSLMELRFQLKGTEVYRILQIPSNYTFALFAQVICFFFGWQGSHKHSWSLVKDVIKAEDSDEIEKSTLWKTLKMSHSRRSSTSKVAEKEELESDWTLAQLWGPGGVWTTRGAVFQCDNRKDYIVDITLRHLIKLTITTNVPKLVEGEGAPASPPQKKGSKKKQLNPGKKMFFAQQFHGKSFKHWLTDEISVVLDHDHLRAHPHSDKTLIVDDEPSQLPATSEWDSDEDECARNRRDEDGEEEE